MKTIHTSHFRSPSVGCRARSTIWTGLPTAREKDQLSSLRLFRAYSQKETLTARDVALAYYENYNDKNIEGVLELIAEDVVYEDLIYQEPFRGRDAVKAYFNKIEQLVPKDIKFVVEDITDGDPKRVGVRW